MNKEELRQGIYSIGEYIHEVSGEDEDTNEAHIKHFYEVLDELEKVI